MREKDAQIVRDEYQNYMDDHMVSYDKVQLYSSMPFCALSSISFDDSGTRFLFDVPLDREHGQFQCVAVGSGSD